MVRWNEGGLQTVRRARTGARALSGPDTRAGTARTDTLNEADYIGLPTCGTGGISSGPNSYLFGPIRSSLLIRSFQWTSRPV